MATEFWSEWGGDLAITLTPGSGGQLEVRLDGTKIFDRKAEGGKYPDLQRVRQLKEAIAKKLEA